MSYGSGFRGTRNGAVQTSYTDQPGIAVPGQIAFASDHNLKDALFVGETNGVGCGQGVRVAPISDDISLQRPNDAMYLPEADDLAADLAGVVVFDEGAQSDENGNPGWAYGRVGQMLRVDRVGGRIYVAAKAAIARTDLVYWVVSAGTQEVYALGDFAPAALGGGNAGVTVLLPNARWVTGAAAGGVAILELRGSVTEFSS